MTPLVAPNDRARQPRLDVDVRVTRPPRGLPYDPSVGAHELAWAYVLDLVFAHAAAHGLAALTLELPSSVLVEPVNERARASRLGPTTTGRGAALLGADAGWPAEASVIYRLHYGLLAPPGLRGAGAVPAGWRLEERYSVYRAVARWRGASVRLAYLVRRPDLADRRMLRVREGFYAEGASPAYYHLTIWRPT